jgi:hypothetical protein
LVQEAVMQRYIWPIALSNSAGPSHKVVALKIVYRQVFKTNESSLGLIGDSENSDDIPILGLRYELGNNSNIIKRALGVCQTHNAVKNTDGPKTTGMIPAVLTAGQGVQVEVDAKSIFACPFDRFEEVCPRSFGEERFASAGFDCPVSYRDTDVIETGTCDLSKILLRDKSLVMRFKLVKAPVCCICGHVLAESPFIYGWSRGSSIWFEKSRSTVGVKVTSTVRQYNGLMELA